MNNKEINSDDICDIYSRKICDNCGKCLEIDGVDIRAINIEDIAKNVEENQYLEDQLNEAKELLKYEQEEELVDNAYDKNNLIDTIDNSDDNSDDNSSSYVDAFDDIVYFDDIGLDDESNIDELTEEVYPGIRKFKK